MLLGVGLSLSLEMSSFPSNHERQALTQCQHGTTIAAWNVVMAELHVHCQADQGHMEKSETILHISSSMGYSKGIFIIFFRKSIVTPVLFKLMEKSLWGQRLGDLKINGYGFD